MAGTDCASPPVLGMPTASKLSLARNGMPPRDTLRAAAPYRARWLCIPCASLLQRRAVDGQHRAGATCGPVEGLDALQVGGHEVGRGEGAAV